MPRRNVFLAVMKTSSRISRLNHSRSACKLIYFKCACRLFRLKDLREIFLENQIKKRA